MVNVIWDADAKKLKRIEKDIFEASPDAEFYELTDENIDHFFGE